MRLPIGQSDFREIIEGGFEFVDKSLLIQDVLDDTQIILITRPRRFGKTLNLSMLQYFFAPEILGKSTQGLFDELLISKSDQKYLEHQGKYPVIFLSLKDIKAINFENAYDVICKLIGKLYTEHRYLLSSSTLHEEEKKIYNSILTQEATLANIEGSLKDLTQYLYKYYGKKPIILIDEYDTPVHSAYSHDYYNEMIGFVRNFLGAGLKDNPYLFKAVLTGILRISKESLFSDLNNIEIYSLLRPEYGSYFGFTEIEVLHLLAKAHFSDRLESARKWYNGYQMGNITIYNPWSIINFIKQKGALKPYWVNTSDNGLIRELLINSGIDFKSQIELLFQELPVDIIVDEYMVFPYIKSNESAVWNLFLMAGYLKIIKQKETDQGSLCTVAIPNREVRNLFQKIVELWLSDGRTVRWYNQFLHELLNGNVIKLQKYLSEILIQTVSVHDVSKEPEAFYHGLMLGLTASIHNEYEIKSNREAGFGFYDIAIIPRDRNKLGIVIELKISEDKNLEKTADTALKQIEDKGYATELITRGIKDILKLGIAFSGKQIHIAHLRTV